MAEPLLLLRPHRQECHAPIDLSKFQVNPAGNKHKPDGNSNAGLLHNLINYENANANAFVGVHHKSECTARKCGCKRQSFEATVLLRLSILH